MYVCGAGKQGNSSLPDDRKCPSLQVFKSSLIRGIHLDVVSEESRDAMRSDASLSLILDISCISLKRELPLTLEYNFAIILFG